MSGPAQRRCDLAISGGRLLALDPEGCREGMTVLIDGERIIDVVSDTEAEAGWAPSRTIDATGAVVAPGFVDAHVHLGGFLGANRPYVRASGPSPFSEEGSDEGGVDVLTMVATFCAMKVPADMTAAVLRPVFAAMLRSGYTGVVDAGGPGAEGVALAAAEIGIRAAVGPSLADRWQDASGAIVRQADADELLASAAEFVERHDGAGDGRLRALVSAVDPTGCTDELLRGIAELAEVAAVPLHVHSNITDEHVRGHVALTGSSFTERLGEAGMLTPACTIMHAGSLTDADIETYVSTGVTVNHNPVGNALYGFGVTGRRSVPRLLEAGVPVALGTDWVPAVTSPFELVRAVLMLQRDHAGSDAALTLEQALSMATNGGACLGRPQELGTIAPGQLADLVLVDVTASHHLASVHPVPALALHARASDVRTVIVGGQVVVDETQPLDLDERRLLAEAHEALAHLG